MEPDQNRVPDMELHKRRYFVPGGQRCAKYLCLLAFLVAALFARMFLRSALGGDSDMLSYALVCAAVAFVSLFGFIELQHWHIVNDVLHEISGLTQFWLPTGTSEAGTSEAQEEGATDEELE